MPISSHMIFFHISRRGWPPYLDFSLSLSKTPSVMIEGQPTSLRPHTRLRSAIEDEAEASVYLNGPAIDSIADSPKRIADAMGKNAVAPDNPQAVSRPRALWP